MPRWLRWGLWAVGVYLMLVGFVWFVMTPLGLFFKWFGPIVGVALIALLNVPVLLFPTFRNPGFEPAALVFLQIPPTTLVYFLLGASLGALRSVRQREPQGTKGFLLAAVSSLVVIGFILLVYQRLFSAPPARLPTQVPSKIIGDSH